MIDLGIMHILSIFFCDLSWNVNAFPALNVIQAFGIYIYIDISGNWKYCGKYEADSILNLVYLFGIHTCIREIGNIN